MLETIRGHKSKVTGILIAGFCALLMIGFGVSAKSNRGRQHNDVVATVNGKNVTVLQLENRHRELSSRLREQLGEHFEQFEAQLNLKQQALDSIITEMLVEDFTDSLGLTAGSEQIEKKILSSPYFRGGFSQAAFDGFLRAVGMTAQQLEYRTRKDIVREQLTAISKDLIYLTDAELQSAYQTEHAKVTLNYVEINADDFKSKVSTTDEAALSAYYDQHKESYRTQRQVRFSYVEFRPEEYLSAVDVPADEVEAAYRERQAEFFEPAQAHLRKIFIAAPREDSKLPFEQADDAPAESTNAGREAKKKLADAAMARLKSGEAFEVVAGAVTEDAKAKAAGGDIGWVSETALSPEEQEALDSLDLQQYSGVIDTGAGYSILYLEEMKKREAKPLEQVKDIILTDLKRTDAPMYAKISADEFKTKWDASGSPRLPLAEFSKSQNKEVRSSGSLSATPQANIPADLFRRALERNEGDEEVVALGDITYLLVIDEVKEPVVPELKTVRERVVQEYVTEKSRELAQATGDEMAKELSAKSLDAVAAAHQLKVQSTEPQTRESAKSGVWSAPSLQQVAFSLQEEHKPSNQLFASGRKFYLIELAKREIPGADEVAKNMNSMRSEKLSASGMRLLEALVSALRAEAKISVDNEMLDAA